MNKKQASLLSPFCGVAIMAALLANSASATTVLYTDRATFQSAASALVEEGFNVRFDAAPSVDFGDFNVSAANENVNSGGFPEVVSEGARAIYGFDPTPVIGIGNAFRFEFDQPITAFGIDINDIADSPPSLGLILRASNNGSLSPPTSNLKTAPEVSNLFFGVIDSVPFTRLFIEWNDAGYVVGFDYLQYTDTAVVPVPAAAWLFGSGLIGLIGIARRIQA
jgi:hypothetical protein